jgi:tetratricopeptide (TPR) repeat protein
MQINQAIRALDDRALRRAIRMLVIVLALGTVGFVGFYVLDRWVMAPPPIIDQQVVALEDALRASPNDIALRGQLADTYVRKGRLEEAVTQYDAILATGKAQELAHFGRAAAYMGLGRLDDAARDYQAVVDIAKDGEMATVDTTLEAAYYGLGSIAMQQGRPADAIGHLENALAITRSDADALYLIGTAFLATGQADKAVTVLRASVVFVPVGWREPYVALRDAYTAAGDAALAAWATAMADLAAGDAAGAESRLLGLVDGAAAADAAVGLGIVYESRGDTAAASTWYAKALALEPESNAARLGLSRVGAMPAASAQDGAAQ